MGAVTEKLSRIGIDTDETPATADSEDESSVKRISYSQYAMWKACPHSYKLKYIDGNYDETPSIYTLFGDAMHMTLQTYLHVMFTTTVAKADALNLDEMLSTKMQEIYAEKRKENNGEHFVTQEQFTEIYLDGVAIISAFKKERSKHFEKKGWELVGVEVPLLVNALDDDSYAINMKAFLDIVLRNTNTGEIVIVDFKTSTSGWSKWQKGDEIKVSQLVLYKHYYAKQYNVDADTIEIKYLILKRKVDEQAEYPNMRRRLQTFVPHSGKIKRFQIAKNVKEFVTACFNADGSYKTDVPLVAVAGYESKNCKFCAFRDKPDMCNPDSRIVLEYPKSKEVKQL